MMTDFISVDDRLPEVEFGRWSDKHLVITSLNRVVESRFFNGEVSAFWERVPEMLPDEQVVGWMTGGDDD